MILFLKQINVLEYFFLYIPAGGVFFTGINVIITFIIFILRYMTDYHYSNIIIFVRLKGKFQLSFRNSI